MALENGLVVVVAGTGAATVGAGYGALVTDVSGEVVAVRLVVVNSESNSPMPYPLIASRMRFRSVTGSPLNAASSFCLISSSHCNPTALA